MIQEEIAKILLDNEEFEYDGSHEGGGRYFNRTQATKELQKLFLQKQIELLNDVFYTAPNIAVSLLAKRRELETELKQLE